MDSPGGRFAHPIRRLSLNSHRRHLTKDQLTIVAAKIAVALGEEAKKKQLSKLQLGTQIPVAANLQRRENIEVLPKSVSEDDLNREERSANKASKAVNGAVSPRTISEGVKLLKHEPLLAEKVARGEMKIAEAKKQAAPSSAPPSTPASTPTNPKLLSSEVTTKRIQGLLDLFPSRSAAEVKEYKQGFRLELQVSFAEAKEIAVLLNLEFKEDGTPKVPTLTEPATPDLATEAETTPQMNPPASEEIDPASLPQGTYFISNETLYVRSRGGVKFWCDGYWSKGCRIHSAHSYYHAHTMHPQRPITVLTEDEVRTRFPGAIEKFLSKAA